MKAFRDLIINIGGGCNTKPCLFTLVEGHDKPIERQHMQVNLSKPIKPGFRRPLKLVPDESLDKMADGRYASSEILQGDSTFVVAETSTEKEINCYAYGDGALGSKVARIRADGHIGEGVAEITLDIGWEVAHPDATVFGPVVEGPDEAIPTTPPA